MTTWGSILIVSLTFFVLTPAHAQKENLPPHLAAKPPLEFKFQGKTLKALGFTEMQKIGSATKLRVFEPHELRERTFAVVDFQKLLENVYGEKLTTAKILRFTCVDGYQPSFSVEALKKVEKPMLAYMEIGNTNAFQIQKGEKKIDVGPYYLVWDHKLRGEPLQIHLNEGKWPYQLVGVELK